MVVLGPSPRGRRGNPRRLSLLVLWLLWPALTFADESDSLQLFGNWRWIGSTAGLSGLRASPEACGCERLLSLKRSRKYEFVEQDSAHEYVLCEGIFAIHPRARLVGEGRGTRTFWISFEGWWYGLEAEQLVSFVGIGTDTISTYPGGPPGLGVSDAATNRYARLARPSSHESSGPRRIRLPLKDRPQRSELRRVPLPHDRAGSPALSDSLPEGEFVYYDTPPVAITRVEPLYPGWLRGARIEADVIVHVLVTKSGLVKSIRVIRGVGGVNEPIVDAVKQWVFKPALVRGEPVAVWTELKFHYPP